MHRKLQVFVSSTYTDLIAERQAAVDAILRAGHIPAGMELFAAGDKSQLDVIRRWIDESDVYMLILGGRYGSIDPDTGKSYTQLEYEYAVERGKRFFAVVLTPDALDSKVKARGLEVAERTNPQKLDDFRAVVQSKVCRMVEDAKEIKNAVYETLLDFLRMYSFTGWVSGKDVVDASPLKEEVVRLSQENADLRAQIDALRSQGLDKVGGEPGFQEIADALSVETHEVEEFSTATNGESYLVPTERSLLEWLWEFREAFVMSQHQHGLDDHLRDRIGVLLILNGLAEKQDASVGWFPFSLNGQGFAFLRYIQSQRLRESKIASASTSR